MSQMEESHYSIKKMHQVYTVNEMYNRVKSSRKKSKPIMYFDSDSCYIILLRQKSKEIAREYMMIRDAYTH